MYKSGTKHRNSRQTYDLAADIERIKNAFTDTAFDVKGKAGEMLSHSVDDLKERSVHMRDNLADYTAEKPFKSLGIALLTGIAIGYLLRRR